MPPEPTLTDALDAVRAHLICVCMGNQMDAESLQALAGTAAILEGMVARQDTGPSAIELDLTALRGAVDDLFAALDDIPSDYFEGDRLAPFRQALESVGAVAGLRG